MRKFNNLNVEYRKTSELIPYAMNAKLHDSEQVEQIKKSIEEFGFNDPIGIDENNNVIEGHGRLIAANELKIDEVPVVVISGLSEEERRAYALVHNKLTINSDFDIDLLSEELDSLTDIDMEKYGFIGGETFFDPEKSEGNKEKGYIVLIVDAGGEEEITDFLNNELIEYKKKNVR